MSERSTGTAARAWLLALAVRALAATWRVRLSGRELLDRALAEGPVILACWHGEQLALIAAHRGSGFDLMVSLSRDGDLLAKVLPHLGMSSVRGSSSRGGSEALEESLRRLGEGRTPAFAVDGPRGPALEPKAGAAVLAARSGRPLILLSARAGWVLRLRSWDRFEIPLPFSRVELRYGRLEPPPLDREAVERARLAIREGLLALSGRAPTPP